MNKIRIHFKQSLALGTKVAEYELVQPMSAETFAAGGLMVLQTDKGAARINVDDPNVSHIEYEGEWAAPTAKVEDKLKATASEDDDLIERGGASIRSKIRVKG